MPKRDHLPRQCSIVHVIDSLAGQWPMIVMAALWERPSGFNDLRRTTGASHKMLSETLKKLEQNGLVSRTVTPSVPISVEYAATPLGVTLADAIGALWDWSNRHIDQVMAARGAWTPSAPTNRPL